MKKTIPPLLALFTLPFLGNTAAFATNSIPDPSTSETPVTAELTLQDAGNITPPNPDVEDNTAIAGHFGIAYAPKTLSANSKLNNSGNQEISLNHPTSPSNNRFNVGVRDTLRKKHTWDLTAQLSWDGDNSSFMTGTTIIGNNGTVMENEDGNGTLVALKDAEVTTTATSLTISETPVKVLETVGKQTNGIYNYGFENPKLVIPATEKVPAGSYTGNITWNLTVTPTATP